MSKGSNPRPYSISKKEFDERYENIFHQDVDYEEVGDPQAKISPDQWEQVDTPQAKIFKPKRVFSWGKTKGVLRKVMNSPIMGFIITITPKPFKDMLKWLKERFKEPSTYQGITVLAGAVGFSVSPEMWESVAAVAASIIGLIQVIKRERAKEDEVEK